MTFYDVLLFGASARSSPRQPAWLLPVASLISPPAGAPRQGPGRGRKAGGLDAGQSAASPLLRHSGEPMYQQLATLLAQRITSGELPLAAQIPTEAALMATHGVSRITVRQAISLLVRNGQLVIRRGKGTFVAAPAMHHDLGALRGFYDALREQGLEPQTELLSFSASEGRAARDLPAGLDLPVQLRRRYLLGQQPFAIVEAWLPQAAAGVGRERAAQLTVFEIVQRFLGERIAAADVAIRSQQARPDIARELGLDRRSSVLMMERCSTSPGGRALEFMRIHIVPDRYEFRLRMPGPMEIARSVRRSVSHQTQGGTAA